MLNQNENIYFLVLNFFRETLMIMKLKLQLHRSLFVFGLVKVNKKIVEWLSILILITCTEQCLIGAPAE